jgi:hypothetical protein
MINYIFSFYRFRLNPPPPYSFVERGELFWRKMMSILVKTAVLSALISLSTIVGAAAQALSTPPTTTFPDVIVHQKTGHWTVPAGYDSDVAMHPYTSGIGPCTEGAAPSEGCHHPTGNPISPSRYERPPFNR